MFRIAADVTSASTEGRSFLPAFSVAAAPLWLAQAGVGVGNGRAAVGFSIAYVAVEHLLWRPLGPGRVALMLFFLRGSGCCRC